MNKLTNLILWLALPCMAIAQQGQRDSVKTYAAPEVVVTATRTSIPEKDAASPTEVLGSEKIRSSTGSTVADALQDYTGVLLREYGGGESLATASLRGAASEHVLVLIDGNRFTGFQNGLVDFNLLPLDNVARIEILHGGASALYGADAVGGVINIITRPADSNFHAALKGSAGSYGFQRYSGHIQGGVGGLGVLIGYSNERAKNDYPFSLPPIGVFQETLHRQDAEYRKQEVYVDGNARLDELSSMDFSVQNVQADRGAPGPLYSPTDASMARQTDKDVSAHLGYRDEHLSGAVLSLSSGFQYGYETYVDPNPFYPMNSFYKNLTVNVNPQVQYLLAQEDRVVAGGEFVQGVLQGNDFGKTIQRTQTSGYVSNEYTGEFESAAFDRLVLFQTLRYDHFSDVGNAVTPKLGFNLRIVQQGDFRIRASYGESYRAPSFNDLYYVPFNNPALHPEHSQSFDAGLLSDGSFWGRHSVEMTYFYANTRDRIVFDPVSYIPVNIGRTLSRGLESTYHGQFFDGVAELFLNYTYTDARKKNSSSPTDSTFDKQLPFIPENLFKAVVTLHVHHFTVNLFRLFTGVRPANDDNSNLLHAYSLTNASVAVAEDVGPWKLTAKVEMDNIFDVQYQVYPNYPMPGRTYRVEIGVTY